jgi:hypothetical protein
MADVQVARTLVCSDGFSRRLKPMLQAEDRATRYVPFSTSAISFSAMAPSLMTRQ